jgi:peptidoglycan-associated lipoprotein
MGEVKNGFLGKLIRKMKNLNLFGAFILTAALLTSGCHRKPSSLTPIPPVTEPPAASSTGNSGVGSGTAIPTTEPPVTTTVPSTGIPLSYGKYSDLLNGVHNEDRDKFKADTVYFDFDRANVKASEESKLQEIAAYFKSNTTDALIIEGNCDERGTEKYNLSLGERRALASREYLANLGVDPQRIKTVTYGASKPVDPGHNEAAWKQNRRDDFVLVTPK